jgi:hypothetical protein
MFENVKISAICFMAEDIQRFILLSFEAGYSVFILSTWRKNSLATRQRDYSGLAVKLHAWALYSDISQKWIMKSKTYIKYFSCFTGSFTLSIFLTGEYLNMYTGLTTAVTMQTCECDAAIWAAMESQKTKMETVCNAGLRSFILKQNGDLVSCAIEFHHQE